MNELHTIVTKSASQNCKLKSLQSKKGQRIHELWFTYFQGHNFTLLEQFTAVLAQLFTNSLRFARRRLEKKNRIIIIHCYLTKLFLRCTLNFLSN